MQDLILRSCDFFDKSNWVYEGLPARLNYLRDIPEIPGDTSSSPWARVKALNEYMHLILTDCYRSPQSSAKAYETKTGVQKPGYSAHNYGCAIDLSINSMMKLHNISYVQLIENCISFGVTPYQGIRIDNKYLRGKEDWHVNIIADFAYHPYLLENETTKPGGSQAIAWCNANIKYETDDTAITLMLHELKYNSLEEFRDKHLTGKLKANASNKDIIIRMLNIYTCKVLDENNNIIPG